MPSQRGTRWAQGDCLPARGHMPRFLAAACMPCPLVCMDGLRAAAWARHPWRMAVAAGAAAGGAAGAVAAASAQARPRERDAGAREVACRRAWHFMWGRRHTQRGCLQVHTQGRRAHALARRRSLGFYGGTCARAHLHGRFFGSILPSLDIEHIPVCGWVRQPDVTNKHGCTLWCTPVLWVKCGHMQGHMQARPR